MTWLPWPTWRARALVGSWASGQSAKSSTVARPWALPFTRQDWSARLGFPNRPAPHAMANVPCRSLQGFARYAELVLIEAIQDRSA